MRSSWRYAALAHLEVEELVGTNGLGPGEGAASPATQLSTCSPESPWFGRTSTAAQEVTSSHIFTHACYTHCLILPLLLFPCSSLYYTHLLSVSVLMSLPLSLLSLSLSLAGSALSHLCFDSHWHCRGRPALRVALQWAT